MGKKDNLRELVNLISLAVVHKIGQLTNPSALYADKYGKEFENFILQAKNVNLRENWNLYDKEAIKKEVKSKTLAELKARDYLDNKKFDILNKELEKVLLLLNLI